MYFTVIQNILSDLVSCLAVHFLQPGGNHKVLHFSDNPLQRSRDKLKKSQVLQAAGATDEEVQALKEALEGEKKMRQRLEEVRL